MSVTQDWQSDGGLFNIFLCFHICGCKVQLWATAELWKGRMNNFYWSISGGTRPQRRSTIFIWFFLRKLKKTTTRVVLDDLGPCCAFRCGGCVFARYVWRRTTEQKYLQGERLRSLTEERCVTDGHGWNAEPWRLLIRDGCCGIQKNRLMNK